MEEVMEDAQLGVVRIKRNSRARQMLFRPCDRGLVVTVPAYSTQNQIMAAIKEMRERLLNLRQRHAEAKRTITPDFRIDNEFFTYYAQIDDRESPIVRHTQNGAVCLYPASFSFEDEDFRKWLLDQITEGIRRVAAREFPPRLRALAEERGLKYTQARISKAKGRWGSCSAQKHISLSLYLLLLPRHLQDHIMHHELTHLVEMNHGPRFHALMDKAVNGREQENEREIRNCVIEFCKF